MTSALLALALATSLAAAPAPAPRPGPRPGPGPDPVPAHELFAAGMTAARAGDTATALDDLERALAASPDDLRYGAEYRQVVITAKAYDRSIDFFARLAEEHPSSAAVRLNWGYAYVDKIPDAGAVTQVILANTALTHFSEAIDLDPTWLALYTRGNSYVYWPAIFGRTKLGIADLERAVEMGEGSEPKAYQAHAYAALGDGWWRLEDLDKAREVWRRGLARYPEASYLKTRLGLGDEALDQYLDAHYEIGKRVETDLRELWR